MKLQKNSKWFANIETKTRRDGSEYQIEREREFYDRGWTHTKHIGRHGNRKPKRKDVRVCVTKYFDDSDVQYDIEVVFDERPSILAETIADCIVNEYKYDCKDGSKLHRFTIDEYDVSEILRAHQIPYEHVKLSDVKLALEQCAQIKSVHTIYAGYENDIETLVVERN